MINHSVLPISVKAIIFKDDKVWLRKNERNEWELPGGKIDTGEQPEETARREALEELGLEVEVERLVDVHIYSISDDETKKVLVISYLCTAINRIGNFEYEGEAGRAEFGLFSLDELNGISVPDFYVQAIKLAIT